MSINFHIPDFLKHFRLNLVLLKTMEQHPRWFREDIKIASVYGAFPPSMWNGGRAAFGTTDERTMKGILDTYNKMGIPCRFTFTNPVLEEKHLSDPFCNKVMQMADNGLNEVIVNSPLLEKYIREKYPSYKITSSTCKQIRDAKELEKELEKDYSLVVLDYNWNNNFDFLEKISRKDKCELLINACCEPDCKRRGEHYRVIGEEQIKFAEFSQKPPALRVPYKPSEFHCSSMTRHLYETTGYSTHINPDDLYGKYVPMGYSHFKIEGRTIPDVNVLESFVYYMVKPEFKDIARLDMLGRLAANVKYFK